MGYDIADYRQINPHYGTLKDVEVLIEKLKEKNIKLIMDLVVNHTSDQHAWFEESRSSKTNPKRDWYVSAACGKQELCKYILKASQVHLAQRFHVDRQRRNRPPPAQQLGLPYERLRVATRLHN